MPSIPQYVYDSVSPRPSAAQVRRARLMAFIRYKYGADGLERWIKSQRPRDAVAAKCIPPALLDAAARANQERVQRNSGK